MRITLNGSLKVEVGSPGDGSKLLRFSEEETGLELVVPLDAAGARRVRDALTSIEVAHGPLKGDGHLPS